MIDIGRVCVKIAGRDAGKKCVVVSLLDKKFVLVDGETRRRKCNIIHLEPLDKVIDIKENASHDDVAKSFKSFGIELAGKKKSKKAVARPRILRRSKLAQKGVEQKELPKIEKKDEAKVDSKEETPAVKTHRKKVAEKK